ncbi:PucR family transcriptional regulator [Dactylosporangium fulvum]|uniref:PucR family transcriptional regulator ligand-binding domain-containing protein n=1 Tax=Dactylosporangium fulvum TaxID=53359 RepID=A0ABY5W3J8_9ACTN|nr:PucR family transcriptional regulator ligand-binding domain-containing protein [Dactylosporangium fulvum]UWP84535.1 PucR family transcriptional regulator ligand-binding domain-containing protein [Dactylosporangium fulvum]
MFPTVREVLDLDPVRNGAPKVVAGERGLDQVVRWVHSSEVPDIATLLRGGELVLTTGIGLPPDDVGLRRFIADLSEVRACGLAVEMGRRYSTRLPVAMVRAADELGLPLVELHRGTPFVLITEAVHSMIIDAQLAELRATEEIHQRFTDLSVEGAGPAEVVAQAAALAGAPVVLENLSRQVLAYDAAGGSAELLLATWEAHSRRIRPAGRTGHDAESGWLVTTVGARGRDWGRLLMRVPTADPRYVILIERAASTLALGRLIRGDEEGQTHRTLLAALLGHTTPVDEVVLRARALGVHLDRRHLVGVVIRPALATEAAQALRETSLKGLVGALDEASAGVLLALRSADDEQDALNRFATRLRGLTATDMVIAAGEGVGTPREARRSLVEASQVAQAARHDQRSGVVRSTDVGLAGLLYLLRDEPRLQTFVERELGELLAYDARHPREQLLGLLRIYLECGRNKSAAAEHSHLSRPAFYERLAKIGKIVGADLDDVSACLSLHVALLALDALRR